MAQIQADTQAQVAAIGAHAQSGAKLKQRQTLLVQAKQQLIREIIQSAKDSLLELDDGAYFR